MLISEAVELFCSWTREARSPETGRTYVSHVRRLAKWLGAGATHQMLTPANLRRYMEEISVGKTAGTRYVYTTAIRSFCEFLAREGLLKGENPAKSALKLPKVRSRPHTPVTDTQVLALFAATERIARPYRAKLSRAVLALLAYTGLRCAELLAVDVAHVDLATGLIYIPRGKGGKENYVGMNAECCRALSELISARDPACLHPGLLAWTVHQRLHKRSLYSLLDDLSVRAGLKLEKPLRPHQFRHGFASRLDRQGASMFQIQAALRHSNVRTTEIYVHSSAERLREVAALASIAPPAQQRSEARRRDSPGRLRRVPVRSGGR